ncbi:MAG: hypothetical protein WCF57_11935 [Pyrinomonadaceae bacterium]
MRASRNEVTRVTIRMYKQGVGDAFLLGFHGARPESARWVLIDCGVVGRPDAAEFMKKVAADIALTTKDAKHKYGHLHRLIVSNVRLTHVAGFVHAESIFKKMAIDEIWLPATEDQGNEQARQRVRERQKRLKELHRVARNLAAEAKDLANSMSGVLGLFGDFQDAAASTAADAATEQIADALALLQERDQAKTRIRYLDVRTEPELIFPDLPAVRVYVLGPRAGADTVGAGRDPATERGKRDLAGSFLAAAAQNNPGMSAEERKQWGDLLERNLPFSPSLQTTFKSNGAGGACDFKPATHEDFFKSVYYAEKDGWRRVDTDWMSVARGLTLALDQEASNASMVLAFELAKSRKVLLFPGDAQLGVWKSWDALEWVLKEDGIERRVTAGDLLRRTAVYKVAHHCSQTGTLIEGGLKRMESGDLVALLPVDRATAKTLGWELPYAPLLNHLREKTRGRILITDPQEPGINARPKPCALNETEWKAFKKAARETALYIEYTLSL